MAALHALSRSCLASFLSGDSEAILTALHILSCSCLAIASTGDSAAFLAALHVLSRSCLASVSVGNSAALFTALSTLFAVLRSRGDFFLMLKVWPQAHSLFLQLTTALHRGHALVSGISNNISTRMNLTDENHTDRRSVDVHKEQPKT